MTVTPRAATRAIALGGALLLVAPSLAAEPPPARGNIRQSEAGWLIEAEEGPIDIRLVRLSRTGPRFGLHYEVNASPMNGKPYYGEKFIAQWARCGNSYAPSGGTGLEEESGAAVAERLAGYLTGCGASPAEAKAALAGFADAFPIARRLARERLAEPSRWIPVDGRGSPGTIRPADPDGD